jgi:hypothetical protein
MPVAWARLAPSSSTRAVIDELCGASWSDSTDSIRTNDPGLWSARPNPSITAATHDTAVVAAARHRRVRTSHASIGSRNNFATITAVSAATTTAALLW